MVAHKEEYICKIYGVEGRNVRVGIFGVGQPTEGVVGYVPRRYFPKERLKAGQTFEYRFEIELVPIKPKVITDSNLARLRSGIERTLP